MRETRLENTKAWLLNYEVVKLYDKVNKTEPFEIKCENDAAIIDIIISSEEPLNLQVSTTANTDPNAESRTYWTNYVKRYLQNRRELSEWTPFIAATETPEARDFRQSRERRDRYLREQVWKENEKGPKNENDYLGSERFREAIARETRTKLVKQRQEARARKKQADLKFAWILPELRRAIAQGIYPPPPVEPTTAKPTTGRPGVHASSADFPRNKTLAPKPPAPSAALEKRRKKDRDRLNQARRSPGPSGTPRARSPNLNPELD